MARGTRGGRSKRGLPPCATSARKTTRTLRCATRLTMATWLGRASWPRDRPWESLAATVTKTCCRRLFIFKEARSEERRVGKGVGHGEAREHIERKDRPRRSTMA